VTVRSEWLALVEIAARLDAASASIYLCRGLGIVRIYLSVAVAQLRSDAQPRVDSYIAAVGLQRFARPGEASEDAVRPQLQRTCCEFGPILYLLTCDGILGAVMVHTASALCRCYRRGVRLTSSAWQC